jgi:hypothetical protein
MKPGDLVLIGDSEGASEFWDGWQHTQPFLVVRRLSKEDPIDVSWTDRFGYFYDAWQHKELKIPVEECVMVMNASGSFMKCPKRCLKTVARTNLISVGD